MQSSNEWPVRAWKTFFITDEANMERSLVPYQDSMGGKFLKLERKKQSEPLLTGSDSSVSLSSQYLRNSGSGWGCRTRTCE